MELINFSQPAENNKAPILAQLHEILPDACTVLEVGSGSGQHAIFFARSMPKITWMPTDQGDYFPGLGMNIDRYGPPNAARPLYIDLHAPHWPEHFDVLYSANVIHIMSEALLPQMFLSPAPLLLFYGPFKYKDEFTSESNARFDLWLKERNPLSGVRDIEKLIELGGEQGYQLISDTPMPANNQFLQFRRD